MKNIFYSILAFTLIFSSSSCTKELEFGSNFEFKVDNLNNETTILLNNEKSFSIEVLNAFSQSNSKNYKVSYKANDVELISDNTTLLPATNYPFVLSDKNTIDLKLKASATGNIKITFTLTDDEGTTKEQTILIKVINDLSFNFEAVNKKDLYEDIITTAFPFSLSLQNTGSGVDTYKIKAFSSSDGTIILNDNLLVPNKLTSISTGNINVSFTPTTVGTQTLNFIVVNSANVEKEIVFKLNVQQKVFTVLSVATLSVKETINSEFNFTLGNTIPNWQYQVKFNSNTQSNIYDSTGKIIPLNTFVNLTLNKASFTFEYLTNSAVNDILTITVQDPNNQTVSSSVKIVTASRPTIVNVDAKIINSNAIPQLQAVYKIIGAQAYGSSTITDYEFKITNYDTGNLDVYTNSTLSLYGTDYSYLYYFYRRKFINNQWVQTAVHTPILNEDRTINHYLNQPYTVRVKDSDGVWSNTITGIMTY